jgi:N-carbamoylputrescine amidase
VYKAIPQEETLRRLAHMARESNLVILVGLIEVSEGAPPHISQLIVGPEGRIGLYRKTHLSPMERGMYQPGDHIGVFAHGNRTFGVQLCYEAHFPEISTILAVMGAHILFMPHASPRGNPAEKMKSWMRHLEARAFDNGVFVVACNQVGKSSQGLSFPGVAVILGPDGRVLAQYGGEEEKVLTADLKGKALDGVRHHRMKYFIPHRRPDLYRRLTDL